MPRFVAPLASMCLLAVLTAAPPTSAPVAAQGAVQQFDFQPSNGRLQSGFTAVTPDDAYDAGVGHGFTDAPSETANGARFAFPIFGRRVPVQDAIPASVLAEATLDSVVDTDPFTFRADVPPGEYDVTVWLGDVTKPNYLINATVNGRSIDVERIDVVIYRGRLDQTTLPDRSTPTIGGVVPRTVRVDASGGFIEVTVGPGSTRGPITWDYTLDECPSFDQPEERSDIIVPAFISAGLQALMVHPAADPPLKLDANDNLEIAGATDDPALQHALDLFNDGDVNGAMIAFQSLEDVNLRAARANGLFWVAGHPAAVDIERELLAESHALLQDVLGDNPRDFAVRDLLQQVRMADDAERYRTLYGYGNSSASENMGRSNLLIESFVPGHPYHLKGRILWLRNRGGLDPRRCTVSWERAQYLAGQLDPEWGGANPYVHLYATDEWANDGAPWTFIDWGELAGDGPDWARTLMGTLNSWLDLFEWWSIHRQIASGEIGGGWTDDVEIVPAFGLTAYVLEDASHISEYATIKFTDGIWDSRIVDSDRGYQAQYGDVEHTAEPTGNSLHLYPMLRYGDPEGMERIMKSGKTFADLFLTTTADGHTHFVGNHMSAAQIANNANHRADIPLNGRVTQPFPFLLWYSSNPGIEDPLRRWTDAWVADADRTDEGKPQGIFPQFIWVPTDTPSYPDGTTPWYGRNPTYGQWGEFAKYQYYPYNLAALFYLRTGDEEYRAPFDALQRCAMEWGRAGRPSGPDPAPGQECAWAGGKLYNVAGNTLFEVARATGSSDWDQFLQRFAQSYSRFYLDPSEDAVLDDNMDELAATLKESWPYRTTEGLMTDRILLPGWYNVVAYYLGANVPSFYYGLPVQAATWGGTGRLFAATIDHASSTELRATAYLFADDEREVQLKPWGLDPGGAYVLEAGPASEIAQPPAPVEQTVPFELLRRDEGVKFTLPGRQVYSIRIRQVTPGNPAVALLPDPAISARDITLRDRRGGLSVRVHNIGAAEARDITVIVYDGADTTAPEIGRSMIAAIEAPNDLVPRWADVTFPYRPPELPREITVALLIGDDVVEVTKVNNGATAVVGGRSPDYPPPMLLSLDPIEVAPGDSVAVSGRNFRDGIVVLESEAVGDNLSALFVDSGHVTVTVKADAPEGVYLVSVRNPDGLQSNLLPLKVTIGGPKPTPTPTTRPPRPTATPTATRTEDPPLAGPTIYMPVALRSL